MSEPFIGEIIMFGGNFAPRGWAICDGQLLPISQNSALFSILGTIYGGDGRTTFGLPDLRGRVPIGEGTGPGLSPKVLGEKAGAENAPMPRHSHGLGADAFMRAHAGTSAEEGAPNGGAALGTGTAIYTEESANTNMAGSTVGGATDQEGNGNNNGTSSTVQPFQCINFIIALQGTFPSRS